MKEHKPNDWIVARVHAKPTRRAMELTDFCDERTDPMGSYTGRPADPLEKPVQDADDL